MVTTEPRIGLIAGLKASLLVCLIVGSGLLVGCETTRSATSDDALNPSSAPIVIAHRGASGHRPEHTLAAYRLAIAQGADFIEPDLVPTRDGVLVARHENDLGGTTDVAAHPEFADRRTTKTVSGHPTTGWFTEDFTLAEIKTLRAKERIPEIRPGNTAYDGRFEVATLVEIIGLVKDEEARTGRRVGIYPETKHPTYFAREGMRLDGRRIDVSIGRRLIDTLVAEGFTDPGRVFIQSFEVENLLELQNDIMPAAGIDLPLVQLFEDIDDPAQGPYDMHFNARAGADLRAIYDDLVDVVPGGITATTSYADLASASVLSSIARAYAEGIGPWKNNVLRREPIDPPVDGNSDGAAEITTRLTGATGDIVKHALACGLEVHPYTLRAEETYLTLQRDGTVLTADDEAYRLFEAGVTGLFADHPDIGVAARDRFLHAK